ncbi:unnamed protein product [Cylindrotheca closterium]|uniref:Kinesin light chain n=1 Tax=Cylindrotheca closterium TaxID=2856 RepID=A0AAD2G5I5_9STRA|nr:unnamed protein product [Cylindrotheca closterium]
MRNRSRRQATRGISPNPKRRSVGEGVASPRMNGDYQVLRQHVEKERTSVQSARVSLAASLDQLGEHHVRQREYNEAMDAFTEALREKRSVFWQLSPSDTPGGTSRIDSVFNFESETERNEEAENHDKAIDEMIGTLRNIGNVHSLRGEQDEAMRYFREVTSLRAQKSAPGDASSPRGDSASFLSGLNDDGSSMMAEINEDVKALDDLFRSITFRGNSDGGGLLDEGRALKPPIPMRRSMSSPTTRKRKSSSSGVGGIIENEPFKRSISSLDMPHNTVPIGGSESNEAMDMYRSLLETYEGENLNRHKEMMNSLTLRADLLTGSHPKGAAAGFSHPDMSKSSDLDLAVEIYREILSLQEERQKAAKKRKEKGNLKESEEQELASNVASTLICMGSVYYKLGNRMEELRTYLEAKDIYLQAFGETHPYVAGTRKNIGMVLAERGEYKDALAEFEAAMKIYRSVNNGDDLNRDVASAISCMGNVKNRLGELDAALTEYMEALRIYKAIHEQNTTSIKTEPSKSCHRDDSLRDVTSTLKVIGMVHAKTGDSEKAMTFFQEAMTLLRTSGEESNTLIGRETTASVLTRIASIHMKRGDFDLAMTHYREAYDLTVSNRGTTNHHEVASILHYIGGIYHKRSDFDEAMACYQEAIRIYHSTLGPENPTVAGTLVMVGSIHYKRRNLDNAMMFYREGLRLNRDAYGLHHPDVAPIMKSIGTILTKKGDLEEAYTIFRDVLSIKCTVHGTSHPEVASAYKSLGNVHYKLGNLADAEREYRHALSIYRRTKGENHPDTMSSKTTIEHLRYWMKEREQRQLEQRHAKNVTRQDSRGERSC